MSYQKGDIWLQKYTRKLYIFDGNEWLEIVPTVGLKKPEWNKLNYEK